MHTWRTHNPVSKSGQRRVSGPVAVRGVCHGGRPLDGGWWERHGMWHVATWQHVQSVCMLRGGQKGAGCQHVAARLRTDNVLSECWCIAGGPAAHHKLDALRADADAVREPLSALQWAWRSEGYKSCRGPSATARRATSAVIVIIHRCRKILINETLAPRSVDLLAPRSAHV